jgi:hypothetical protein
MSERRRSTEIGCVIVGAEELSEGANARLLVPGRLAAAANRAAIFSDR